MSQALMTHDQIVDLSERMSPAQWRVLLCSAADSRCIACGHSDECECSDDVDDAKDLVVRAAADLVTTFPDDAQSSPRAPGRPAFVR